MSLLNSPAYSTCALMTKKYWKWQQTWASWTPMPIAEVSVNNWNITESGIKNEPPDPPCLHQRSGKWLKHYWKCQKHELPEPPAYSTGVLNDWNIIESVIKHEPPEPSAYSKGVINDWNNIESGIHHETLEPPCQQQKCGRWLNIVSNITHEPPDPPSYNRGVVEDWTLLKVTIDMSLLKPLAYSNSVVNDWILKMA